MVKLGTLETPEWLVDALMMLQYEFPIVEDPFQEIADKLNVSLEALLDWLKKLKEQGILKRVGFYYNPRSEGIIAALIGFSTEKPREVDRVLGLKLTITHSYVRDHPRYKLWIVVRARNLEEIVRAVEDVCAETLCNDWVILPGRKTLRLSVKYDLNKGISRAGPYSRVVENPPSPEELGYPKQLARSLRSLPLEPKPFEIIGRRFGMKSYDVVDAVKVMLSKGILGDPGAVLDSHALGFRVNVMYVLEPLDYDDGSAACKWVLENIDEATHVVLRSVFPEKSDWKYTCYFMVHATSKDLLSPVEAKLRHAPVKSFMGLISLIDLRPSAER